MTLPSLKNNKYSVLPVVVEDLGEDAGVSVEEVLVQHGVVVGEGFRESGQPRGRDLLERRLVRLVPYPSDIKNHTVLRVHIDQTHLDSCGQHRVILQGYSDQ